MLRSSRCWIAPQPAICRLELAYHCAGVTAKASARVFERAAARRWRT